MLTLYGTAGCHLCDEAEQLLKQAARAQALNWSYVDIADDEVLVEQYGMRIPLVVNDAGKSLAWPFSLLDLLRIE